MSIPNLKDLFGAGYQIRLDAASEHRDDPAMFEIPCRYGRIYPYGAVLLAAEVDRYNKVAARVGRIAGTKLVQDGDDEHTYAFAVDLFPLVASLVLPYRRPRINHTEEHLPALVRVGPAYRSRK
jgi:hypothetical protein